MAGKNHLRSSFVLISIIGIALSLCAFTCQKRTKSPIIARVGNAVLTLDDLFERIPAEYSDRITREQKINYVKLWIDTELLYQEALRRGIQKEPEIAARLLQMKKTLLSSEVISRNATDGSKYPISEDAVRSYYETHKQSFIREAAVVKYLEIVVDNESTAKEVMQKVATENFIDLAMKYSKAPVQDARSIPFVTINAIAKNIGDAIAEIKINGTTAPINVDGSFHIIRILDKQLAGTQCSLEEVRDEIVGSLSTNAQKKIMDDFLAGLRLKTDFELHIESIPGPDSVTSTQGNPG